MALKDSWMLAGLSAAAGLLLIVIIRYLLSTQRPKDFPPGPPTLPGIGNLHQIPVKQPFYRFTEWSKTYGNIIGLKIGSENLVILNDPLFVHELFSKRGISYSGRRFGYIVLEHVFKEHRDKHILNIQYGPYLRKWRAAATSLFNETGQKHTKRMQEATSATLVYKLLETTSSETLDHLKHWALATPLLAITGQRLEDRGKAFSDRFFLAQKRWMQLLEPGTAPPVELFPFLRWVPELFAEWKTKAKYVRAYQLDEYFSFLHTAKKLSGTSGDGKADTVRCLMTKILEEEENEKKDDARFTDDDIAYLGGGLIDAAVDTTWATMNCFVMFMAAYPAEQEKVFEEIMRSSPDAPPGRDTAANLPYLRACLLEMIRLRPPAPSGVPHLLTQDDMFNGYRIPKGTTIVANVWGLQHNADSYDQPDKFLPERYINDPLGLKDGVDPDRRKATYVFGTGRRSCTGEQFALTSIMTAMAKILWAYEIKALEVLDLDTTSGFHDGIILNPKPYKVEVNLRDSRRRASVLHDYEASLGALREIGL